MKSLYSVIKSSNLVISRAREVQYRSDAIIEEVILPEVEVETDTGTPQFSEDEAQLIIAETEAMVKQLLKKAEEQSAAIIKEAREEAKDILVQAQSEAEDLKRASEQQGYSEGEERVKREMEAALQSALQEAEQLIAQARQERERMLIEVEPQVVDLAIAVAKKIIGRQIEMNPETVRNVAREALGKAKGTEELVVKVNEASFEALRSGWEEVVPDTEMARRCTIEIDNLVEPGGCVVDTQAGLIDARISTQLSSINNALEQVKTGGY